MKYYKDCAYPLSKRWHLILPFIEVNRATEKQLVNLILKSLREFCHHYRVGFTSALEPHS